MDIILTQVKILFPYSISLESADHLHLKGKLLYKVNIITFPLSKILKEEVARENSDPVCVRRLLCKTT